MPHTLENPVTGERFTFHVAAPDRLAFDLELAPGGAVPMPHVHPHQEERFEVLAGRMRFRVGLGTVEAGPGDLVVVPPGVVHGFANAGDEDAVVRVDVTPALDMKAMLTEVVGLARAGRMTRRGLPRNLLDLAVLARTYGHVARAPWIPGPVQRALLAPLAWLAGLRGSRRAEAMSPAV